MKAIVLLDGDNVVFTGFNVPATESSTIFGFSMGKTLTAMAVGQAICQGKLSLDTKVADVIPTLATLDLGKATVHDLLRMASGVFEGNPDSTIWSPEQAREWSQGRLDLYKLVSDSRVATARRGIFGSYKPGEIFNYKSTDPLVLGMMVSRATAMPWSAWIQTSVLDAMGAAHSGLYIQDRHENGLADSGARLKLSDWSRFAVWVKRQSRQSGCFGDFVRAAFKMQIRNAGTAESRSFGKLFGGYGYLVWVENEIARDAVFASGWGGQRISWSTDPSNSRMVIVISSVESWMPDLYAFVRDWNRLPSAAW